MEISDLEGEYELESFREFDNYLHQLEKVGVVACNEIRTAYGENENGRTEPNPRVRNYTLRINGYQGSVKVTKNVREGTLQVDELEDNRKNNSLQALLEQ